MPTVPASSYSPLAIRSKFTPAELAMLDESLPRDAEGYWYDHADGQRLTADEASRFLAMIDPASRTAWGELQKAFPDPAARQ